MHPEQVEQFQNKLIAIGLLALIAFLIMSVYFFDFTENSSQSMLGHFTKELDAKLEKEYYSFDSLPESEQEVILKNVSNSVLRTCLPEEKWICLPSTIFYVMGIKHKFSHETNEFKKLENLLENLLGEFSEKELTESDIYPLRNLLWGKQEFNDSYISQDLRKKLVEKVSLIEITNQDQRQEQLDVLKYKLGIENAKELNMLVPDNKACEELDFTAAKNPCELTELIAYKQFCGKDITGQDSKLISSILSKNYSDPIEQMCKQHCLEHCIKDVPALIGENCKQVKTEHEKRHCLTFS